MVAVLRALKRVLSNLPTDLSTDSVDNPGARECYAAPKGTRHERDRLNTDPTLLQVERDYPFIAGNET